MSSMRPRNAISAASADRAPCLSGGQAARNRRPIPVEELPEGYVTISSGLGQAVPSALTVLPIVVEE